MTRGQKRSLIRRTHRWVGSVASLVVLVVALSGIALQHPRWLGPVANHPRSLAIDPTDAQRMLRGTHWGVEESRDGGERWREVTMLAPPTDVRRILFVPGRSGQLIESRVYALGAESLVVSHDAGRVWQKVAGPDDDRLPGAQWLDLSVSAAGELDLLTTVGHYRRVENGRWVTVGPPLSGGGSRHRWLHDLHTGHLFGLVGRRTAEGGAWALVMLTLTGLVLHRRVSKRRKT